MSSGQAPHFSLPDSNGETFTFTPGQSGLPTAIFFYPKAGSLGCTLEVCQFRDAIAEKDIWKSNKVQVIGISRDPIEKQKSFATKNKLTYPVLSDVQGDVSTTFGVTKGILGNTRITFIIDSKGIIRDSIANTINFSVHSKFVTKWLERLNEEAAESGETEPTASASAEVPAPAAAAA